MPYRWRWLPIPLVGHANTIGTLINAINADNAYQHPPKGGATTRFKFILAESLEETGHRSLRSLLGTQRLP
jgi:hypothetical protein